MRIERIGATLNPDLHLWGWEVALEQFLAALAGGLLVLVAWAHLSGRRRELLPAIRAATSLALAAVMAGLLLLWLDLGGKWRPFWLYLTVRPTSIMWWGSWIILGVVVSSSLTAVPSLVKAEGEGATPAPRWLYPLARWAELRMGALAWMNLVLGIALGLYPGVLLGTLVARPAWNSAVLGPLFLASGMVTATAALLLLVPGGPWAPLLVRFHISSQGGRLALLGLYLIGLATGGAAQQTAAALLVRGPWALPFWVVVVGAGILVPVAVAVRQLTARPCAGGLAATAWVLTLAGDLTLRVVLVYAGQQGL
ncbi:MAG: polysulfide reductase NrfD [Firmicutes bacterium]|nr:polysulfide reductase NrfD [Bacillota bacterium]